nr:hypothetical protein [Suipraeoptans intestinalis]
MDARKRAGKRFYHHCSGRRRFVQRGSRASKKERKQQKAAAGYPSVAYEIAEKIQERTDQEVRITVPGHAQRGGAPVLTTGFWPPGWELRRPKAVLDGQYGCMLGVRSGEIVRVPLEEVAGRLKGVDPKAEILEEARQTGISFGI